MKRLTILIVCIAMLGLTSCDQETLQILADEIGVDPELELEPYTGENPVTTDNYVIDGKYIDGQLTINADGVTVRNSKIINSVGGNRTRVIRLGEQTVGTLIEDSDLIGQGNYSCSQVVGWTTGGGGSTLTIDNVEMQGCEDGVRVFSDTTITGSMIWNLDTTVGDPSPHADAIQTTYGGDNVIITGNYFFAPWRFSNAVFQIAGNTIPVTNWLIEDNVLSGGNYLFNGSVSSGVIARNNILEDRSTKFPADNGSNPPEVINRGLVVNMTLNHCGNVWEDFNNPETDPYPADEEC